MAKSKQGPALFELLKGTQAPGAIPDHEEAGPADQDRSGAGVAPAPQDRPGSAPATGPRGSGEIARRPAVCAAEPPCEIDGDRIRFSLTQRTATIAVAAFALALAGVGYSGYRLGKERGKEQGRLAVQGRVLDEIEQARRTTPTRNLFDGIGDDPTAAVADLSGEQTVPLASAVAEALTPLDVPWVSGHNYIVVQDFKSDARGDAIRARDFLEDNGVGAAILQLERSGPYGYRLITVTGFNLDDPVQKRLADRYLHRVRRIGEAYSQSGGRYDFASAYFKKRKENHW